MEVCTLHLEGQPADYVALADYRLRVGGHLLPVHSQTLAKESAWFRSLFATLKEGLCLAEGSGEEVALEDQELAPLSSLLRIIYSPSPATVLDELVAVKQEEGEWAGLVRQRCVMSSQGCPQS